MPFSIGLNLPGSAFDAWLNPSNPFADALAPLGKMIGGALDEKMGLGDYWKSSRNYGAENRPDRSAGRAKKSDSELYVDEFGIHPASDAPTATDATSTHGALFKQDGLSGRMPGGEITDPWLPGGSEFTGEMDRTAFGGAAYGAPDPGTEPTPAGKPAAAAPVESSFAAERRRLEGLLYRGKVPDGVTARAAKSHNDQVLGQITTLNAKEREAQAKSEQEGEKARKEAEDEAGAKAYMGVLRRGGAPTPEEEAVIAKSPKALGLLASTWNKRQETERKESPDAVAAAAARAAAIAAAKAKAGAATRQATRAAEEAIRAKDWRALLGPDSEKLSDAWLAENGHLEYSKMLTAKIAQDKAKAESPRKFFDMETKLSDEADQLANSAKREWTGWTNQANKLEEGDPARGPLLEKAAKADAVYVRYAAERDAHFHAAKGYLEEAQTGRPPAKAQEESGNPFWDRALFNWLSGKTPTEAPPPPAVDYAAKKAATAPPPPAVDYAAKQAATAPPPPASSPSATPGPNGMSVSSVTSRAEPVRPPEEAALRESIASEFSALPAPQQTKENLDAIKAAYAIAIPDFGGDKAAAAKWFDEQPINQFGPVGKVLAKRLQAKMKGK